MKVSPIKIGVVAVMLCILAGVVVGVVLLVVNKSDSDDGEVITFPVDFKIGAASASYQIEGAWDEDGKSPNIWDTLTHKNPFHVADLSNGDVAADSYHMIDKDIDALVNIGFEVYRFSISWSRIIPDGGKVNMKGIQYYSNLIDKLIAKNIEPLVTIFHWDLPQYIQDLGGWTNPLIVDYFRVYSDTLFEHFGDRVKRWITINEPASICTGGYSDGWNAPALRRSGVADYLCNHHIILANAAAYHVYKEKYFAKQQGQVGICLNAGYAYPAEGVDPKYTDVAIDFDLGKYANAIFSKDGDYPKVMIDMIAEKSRLQGYPESRLPAFTQAEKEYVHGTSDFLALNYYSSSIISPRTLNPGLAVGSWGDSDIDGYKDPSWKQANSWLFRVPEGLRDLLKWIKDKYDNPIVMITENGWGDDGRVDDEDRTEYIKAHLNTLSKAIKEDGCKVVAYTVWSLTDNFEWAQGYTDRFGIHSINFDSKNKERVPKKSALFFKEMMKTKSYEL